MKPLLLSIEGLNSFIDKQTIDFELIGADNLFAISGVTGSGKTTILDAIILALYPTADGRGAKHVDYINLKCDKAVIDFTFELDGETYRTVRTIHRKQGKNSMVLYKGGVPIEENKPAYALLSEKIGLDGKDFTNVVVLQQGEFSKFLRATKSDRIKTVSSLFDLKRFNSLYNIFNGKVTRLSAELHAYTDQLSSYETVTEQAKDELTASLTAAQATLATAQTAAKTAQKAADDTKKAYDEYIKDCAAKKRVSEITAELATVKQSIEKGNGLRDELLAASNALMQKESKRDELVSRSVVLSGIEEQYAKLAQREKEITRTEQELLAEQDKLAQKASEISALGADIRKKEQSAALCPLPTDEVDGTIDALTRRVAQMRAIKDRLIDVRRSLGASVDDRRAKAAVVAKLRAGESEQRTLVNQLNDRLAEAKKLYEKAMVDNAAIAIASTLRQGDNCPVCGGKITHSVTASGGDVTQLKEQMDELENSKAAADKLLRELTGGVAKAQSDYENALKAHEQLQAQESALLKQLEGYDEQNTVEQIEQYKKFRRYAEEMKNARQALTAAQNEFNIYSSNVNRLKQSHVALLAQFERDASELDKKAGADYKSELLSVKAQLDAMAGERKSIDEKMTAYDARLADLNARRTALEGELKGVSATITNAVEVTSETLAAATENANVAQTQASEAGEQVAKLTSALAVMTSDLARKNACVKKLSAISADKQKYEQLSLLFYRGAFSEFVVGEYIKEFTAAASSILSSLTHGKYTLYYEEDDGEFFVSDFLAGNEKRNVKTLSGGETFLASLSLAIAISRQLSRDKNYDFFFIDEGFGTLSEDAIETVTAALESLAKDTMVGVITHRNELIERMPCVVKVTQADENSGSKITI